MAVLAPELKARIEADQRVRQAAQSGGTVSTETLRALGYDVPDHTKYALSQDGKGFRSQGAAGGGFAYNDEAGTASKLVTAGALGVISAGLAPGISGLAGGGSTTTAAPSLTYGAGATPGASGGGGMGFFSSIGKFLGSNLGQQAIETGGQLVGGAMQARAAGQATDAQLAAQREALQFEKDIYANDVRDFAPYQAAGNQSIGRLSELAAAPRPSMTSGDIYGSGSIPRTGRPMGGSISGMAGQTQRVMLQAPDGTTKEVDAGQAEHFMRLGARRVS